MTTRKRALPRGWYPGSAAECKSDVEGFLRDFTPPGGTWRGGVAPHAGWFFSGKAAARVVKALSTSAGIDRLVIYGGHLPGRSRPIVYTEDSWETPFGPQPLDSAFAHELISRGDAVAAPENFSDNTVEIQIPIAANFFADIPIIAVHSPSSERAIELSSAVCGLIEEKGYHAAYLGSADLTHYGPNYGFIPQGTGPNALEWVKTENDRSLIEKALAMDTAGVIEDALLRHNTCSAGPIASVMASVARCGVERGRLLEYYTSYDVMPDSSFVGYAAILY